MALTSEALQLPAGANDLHGPPESLGRAALIASLRGETRVLLRQFLDDTAFRDRVGERLLAVDVPPAFEHGPAHRHMPMIRRRHDHGIDVALLVEQLPIVAICSGVAQPIDGAGTVELPLIDVADGHDLLVDFRKLREEIATHVASHADACDREPVVRRRCQTASRPQKAGHASEDGRGLEEAAA